MIPSTAIFQGLFPELISFNLEADRLSKNEIQAQPYSNEYAKYNALINQICLESCLNWLNEVENLEEFSEIPIVRSEPQIWEFLNGTAIEIDGVKWCLIPHTEDQTETFSIPQEWIDLSDWHCNYYLPIHIDLQTQMIYFLGYISHRTIKTKAYYDDIHRFYEVDRSNLIPDLSLLKVAKTLALDETVPIDPLPLTPLHPTTFNRLSQSSPYSPRLEVSFAEWARILQDESLRQHLYERRLTPTPASSSITNLRQWVQRNFEAALHQGWQTIDNLLTPQAVSYGFRNPSSSEIITLAKLINLQVRLETTAIVLLIALTPHPDQTISLLIQAHPDRSMQVLPEGLVLSLEEENGVLQMATSRSYDQFIQLRRFTCTINTQFQIRLILNGNSVLEQFTVDETILES